MMAFLLLLTPLWPLLLIIILGLGRWTGHSLQPYSLLWLTAPVPALLLALLSDGDPASTYLKLDWLLLGSLWWLDEVRQVFLLLTSLLWLLGGAYARGYMKASGSFALLWLLTLSGNLLLIVAEDVASFYLGFALMTFCGYGLVIHFRSDEALRAGRVYIILAVLGEGLMLAGLLGTASQAAAPQMSQLGMVLSSTEQSGWLLTCLLLGFGVKAGLPFLHVWLPLAHPVAPTPASAVLSGAMIKAGLLGWWLTLPLGLVSLPQAGQLLTAAGLLAALGAAIIGVMQSRAKSVLAYSSISQMGMMTALFGAGLADHQLWPLLVPALLLFVAHHGLNKGSLFLAIGIVERQNPLPRPLLWILLLLPALALTGVLGSGLMTKWEAKSGLYELHYTGLIGWLTLAAGGTGLLMLRYLWLLQQQLQKTDKKQPLSPWMLGSWLLLLPLGLLVPWWLPLPDQAHLLWPDWQNFMQLALPLPLACLLGVIFWWLTTRHFKNWSQRAIPAGDLLGVYCWLLRCIQLPWADICQGFITLQQVLLSGLQRLQKLGGWLQQITDRELLLRREAALIFTFLLVLLTGLLVFA